MEEYSTTKAALFRAVRAFVFGFLSTVGAISISGVADWSQLVDVLNTIAVSGVIGGINAVLMGLDKAVRG